MDGVPESRRRIAAADSQPSDWHVVHRDKDAWLVASGESQMGSRLVTAAAASNGFAVQSNQASPTSDVSPVGKLTTVPSAASDSSSDRSDLERLRQEVADLENTQLSMELEQILATRSAGVHTGKSPEYITKVARASVEAMHKDHLMETLKALITALEKEVAHATAKATAKAAAEIAALREELDCLRVERDTLLLKISRLEKERDQAQHSPLPAAAAADAHVEQEQQRTAGAASPLPTSELLALQQKCEKQKQSLEKLVSANHRWDEHCKQMVKDYEQRLGDSAQRISDSAQRISDQGKIIETLSSRLEEFKVNDEKRQKDIDRLLLSTKKRLDAAEAERTVLSETVRQVESDRAGLTEALAAAKREADALKQQLEQSRQVCSSLQLERQQWQQAVSSRGQALTSTGRVPPVHAAHEAAYFVDLREQVLILQQQLDVYRDDFNTERSDRERMQQRMLDLQSQHERLKNDFGTQQAQLRRADDDLERLRAEVTQLQAQLAVQAAEIRSLRQSTVKPWRCSRCTYNNVAGRKFCDICGYAGGVGEDGRPLRVDTSLFSAAVPTPSAPNETGDIRGSRSSNLSAELVVADSAQQQQQRAAGDLPIPAASTRT